jgi:hypothetical protein
VSGDANARAARRIRLHLDRQHRVVEPGAALWAWPARSLRELPPQCPPAVAEAFRRDLERWHGGRGARPCVVQRRGHWLVVALDAVEEVDGAGGAE